MIRAGDDEQQVNNLYVKVSISKPSIMFFN